MKLTFLGAAGEVTGSATLVETSEATVLVDFGLHQGAADSDRRNRSTAIRQTLRRAKPDAIVVTHAHIDHVGRLPLLPSWGIKAPIHSTAPTVDLAGLLLRDSAHIQSEDARGETRRRQRGGRKAVEPLYTVADAEAVLEWFRPHECDTPVEIANGVTLRFLHSAHLLGAASVELRVIDRGVERRLVFSGDLGPGGVPFLKPPHRPEHADVLVIESTYGDRDHRPLEETVREFDRVIDHAMIDGGKILIPAFAVGRTQGVLVMLTALRRDGRLPDIPVYVDSPMAIEAGDLYRKWYEALFTDEMIERMKGGFRLIDLPQLHRVRTSDESRRLNDMKGAAIIIAASGMCSGGRILHHLKHNLWKANTDVVIVGYQAEGSLGRRLVNGARRVNVLGASVIVQAKIHTINGLSAHAGRTDLLAWAALLKGDRPRTFVNHGENGPRLALATGLAESIGCEWSLPGYRESFEL
ncbi:MAG: MBL fold metallo-hydrolase [Phycisphaerales bacterium]|nr:MBL fold metallo-hydrolase [Phycisphaerales bacterium]